MRADEVFKDMSDVDELREELDRREMTIRIMANQIEQLTEELDEARIELDKAKDLLNTITKECVDYWVEAHDSEDKH